MCVTTEGNTTSNNSLHFRTMPGLPVSGPIVSSHVANHTSILLSWHDPPIKLLKGKVESYTVAYEVVRTGSYYEYGKYPPNIKSAVVYMLRPETIYAFMVCTLPFNFNLHPYTI